MPDPASFEDDAMLYVLGGLAPGERHKFEARLKESTELRTLVRDLETGAVALALASPQRDPPSQAWDTIKKTITEDGPARIPSSPPWHGMGWAAAACLAVAWLIYTLWSRDLSSRTASHNDASVPVAQPEQKTAQINGADNQHALAQPERLRDATSASNGNSLAQAGQIAVLRRQVRELETQVASLSQAVTQQQTAPGPSGQLRFFHLVRPGAGAAAPMHATPAPELQRALLIALARELGWTPSAQQNKQQEVGDPKRTTDLGVEFIHLPPSETPQTQVAPDVPRPSSPLLAQNETSANPNNNATGTSGSAIPGFQSGTNLVIAVDGSVVPPGTDSVTIWTAFTSGDTALAERGSVAIGNSPTVVTIPFAAPSAGGGWNITLTAGANSGPPSGSNIIGVLASPRAESE